MKKLLCIILLALVSIGCSNKPSEEPERIAEVFFDSLIGRKYSDAYEMISNYDKEYIKLDEFKDFTDLFSNVALIHNFSVSHLETNENVKVYDDVTYEYVAECVIYPEMHMKVTLGKSFAGEIDMNLVSEDNEWKVHFHTFFFFPKRYMATMASALSLVHLTGESGFKKDPEKALAFADIALKYEDDNHQNYLIKSYVLNELKKIDEALVNARSAYEIAKPYYEKIKDREFHDDKIEEARNDLSLILSELGSLYIEKGETVTARKCLKSALKLNRDNLLAVELYRKVK